MLANGEWFTMNNTFLRVTQSSGYTTDYLYAVDSDGTFYHGSYQAYERADFRMFKKTANGSDTFAATSGDICSGEIPKGEPASISWRTRSAQLGFATMWPIVWQFGSYRLGTYGVLVGTAIFVCLWVARTLGRRDGLPEKALNDIGLSLCASGFLGSWLLGVGVNFVQGVPMDWSELRNAGAVHGGLLGGLLALLVLIRHFRLPLSLVLDAYVPAVALGQSIGRLGCFAAGCCFGRPTAGPLGVVYHDPVATELGGVPLGVHLHPVQLYDGGLHLLLCALLVWMHRRAYFRGRLFGVWCASEGALRLGMENFRGDLGRGVWFGMSWLSTGRVTASLFVVVGLILLWQRNRGSHASLSH